MKEPIENILACLSNWNDAKEKKPKDGARIVVFCLHRNGVYDIHVGRRRGKRYWEESDFVPTKVLSCVRYWKYAHGAISKFKEAKH